MRAAMPGANRTSRRWTAFFAVSASAVALFAAWSVRLFVSVGTLRANVERNVREMISLEPRLATDPAAQARTRELRRSNAADSAKLAAKWDQMYAIAAVALLFAGGNLLLIHWLRRRARQLQLATDERLDVAHKHHEARIASMRTLARGLAHEINNPLGWITSNVAWLRQEVVPSIADEARRAEAAEVLEETDEGVRRLSEIVRGLNAVSFQAKRAGETTDIRLAAELAIRFLQDDVAHASVQVDTEWSPVPQVKCSPVQVDQIVSALMNNALQSFPPDQVERRIRISTRTDPNGRVLLEVQDNGPGFSAAARASMFEPFASIDPRRKGLGLFVCKRIAQDCGGDIEILDAPTGGAIVRVMLPVA